MQQKKNKSPIIIGGACLIMIGIILGIVALIPSENENEIPSSIIDGNQPSNNNITINYFYDSPISNNLSGDNLDIIYSILQTYLTHAFPNSSDYSINNSSFKYLEEGAMINISSTDGRIFQLKIINDKQNTNNNIINLIYKDTTILNYNTKDYIYSPRY